MTAVTPTPNSTSLRWAIVLILGVGLSACGKSDAPAPVVAAPAAAANAAVQAAAEQQAAALAAMSEDELKKRGGDALREQRLYAPAGNNAMEYYIALRKKSAKPNASAESALIDLQPYAVIAAEQAITREDFVEALRLHHLIAVSDPQAPALSRIAEAISKGQQAASQRATTDATRTDQEVKAAEAARLLAQQQAQAAAAAPAPVIPTPAPTPAPVFRPPPEPTPAPVVSAPPAPAPVAAPSRNGSSLVPVFAPQPSYPQDALNAGTAGEVVLSFTVNTDGSVSDLNVVSARPRGVFERGVRSSVSRWKFQPIDAPQTITRTFSFKP